MPVSIETGKETRRWMAREPTVVKDILQRKNIAAEATRQFDSVLIDE